MKQNRFTDGDEFGHFQNFQKNTKFSNREAPPKYKKTGWESEKFYGPGTVHSAKTLKFDPKFFENKSTTIHKGHQRSILKDAFLEWLYFVY